MLSDSTDRQAWVAESRRFSAVTGRCRFTWHVPMGRTSYEQIEQLHSKTSDDSEETSSWTFPPVAETSGGAVIALTLTRRISQRSCSGLLFDPARRVGARGERGRVRSPTCRGCGRALALLGGEPLATEGERSGLAGG